MMMPMIQVLLVMWIWMRTAAVESAIALLMLLFSFLFVQSSCNVTGVIPVVITAVTVDVALVVLVDLHGLPINKTVAAAGNSFETYIRVEMAGSPHKLFPRRLVLVPQKFMRIVGMVLHAGSVDMVVLGDQGEGLLEVSEGLSDSMIRLGLPLNPPELVPHLCRGSLVDD